MDDFRSKVEGIYEDDLLDRIPFAHALYNLITKRKPVLKENQNSGSLVVAIDAPWGTGKTHFLDYFEKTIEILQKENDNNYVVVRYNAWENDDFDNPLQSLLYSLVKQQAKRNDVKEKLAVQGKKVIEEIAAPMILKAIKEKTGFDAKKAFEIAKGVLDIEHNQTFLSYEESVKTKTNFKSMMAKLSKDNKIVVLVDELDRCRPTYAIKLLETVKHYLNVENYIFIFALDKNQLSHSIKTQYGEGMDSSGYLRRFFDYVLHFPVPSIKSYIKSILINLNIKQPEEDMLIEDLDFFFRVTEVSFRDADIILNNFIIIWETILNSQTSNHYMMEAYIFLITLKYKYSILYKAFVEGSETGIDKNYMIFPQHSLGKIMNQVKSKLLDKSAITSVNFEKFRTLKNVKLNGKQLSKFELSEIKEHYIYSHTDNQTSLHMFSPKLFNLNENSEVVIGVQLSMQLEMINLDQEQ